MRLHIDLIHLLLFFPLEQRGIWANAAIFIGRCVLKNNSWTIWINGYTACNLPETAWKGKMDKMITWIGAELFAWWCLCKAQLLVLHHAGGWGGWGGCIAFGSHTSSLKGSHVALCAAVCCCCRIRSDFKALFNDCAQATPHLFVCSAVHSSSSRRISKSWFIDTRSKGIITGQQKQSFQQTFNSSARKYASFPLFVIILVYVSMGLQ